jgi:hypothetical protein
MSSPSPSTDSDPLPLVPVNHHDQPNGSAYSPGSRTSRRVQWASAVDEDEVAGRLRDRDHESEAVLNHELDEAGLDVRRLSPLLTFLTVFLLHSQPPSERSLMLSNGSLTLSDVIIAQLPLRLFLPSRLLHNGPDGPHLMRLPQQRRPRQLLLDAPHLISIFPARHLSNLMSMQDSQCRVLDVKERTHSLIANFTPPILYARTPGTHSSSHSVSTTDAPVPPKHSVLTKAQIKRKRLIGPL